jgi:hypothetical protein
MTTRGGACEGFAEGPSATRQAQPALPGGESVYSAFLSERHGVQAARWVSAVTVSNPTQRSGTRGTTNITSIATGGPAKSLDWSGSDPQAPAVSGGAEAAE